MKLSSKTTEMSTHEIRRVVCETIKWCETNLGTKTKSRSLKYRVLTLGDKYTPAYGCYDFNKNCIMVFRNYAPTVKMVVRSVLHEYTHFLQNLRHYDVVLKRVGYDKHPLELQAVAMEIFYPKCWKYIKNKI